jgi:L-aminopeptidase/D-esterase-like protein
MDSTAKNSISKNLLKFNFPDFKIASVHYKSDVKYNKNNIHPDVYNLRLNKKMPNKVGCTIFLFNNDYDYYVDKRGGWVSTMNSDIETNISNKKKAIVFAGGSYLGLESICGVNSCLFKEHVKNNQKKHLPPYQPNYLIKHVAGGCVSFAGAAEVTLQNMVYPDKKLGEFGMKNLYINKIFLGQSGAGCCASVGKIHNYKEYAGQGAYFTEKNKVKVFCFVVLNSLGYILDGNGNIVHGGLRKDLYPKIVRLTLSEMKKLKTKTEVDNTAKNTTLSLVITNVKLDSSELKHYAKIVHSSMGRFIFPFNDELDGDCLYIVSTNKIKNTLSNFELKTMMCDTMEKAIFNTFKNNDEVGDTVDRS